MQARTYQLLENFPAARTAFQATRERALAGAPDPMGLGVASLGDEARLDLMASGLVKVDGFTPSDEDRANAGALIARAVRLYAEQAARGSAMARLSLREVASLLADNETLLRKAIGDETVRRLLVAYCIANDNQSDFDDAINGARDEASTTVIEALLAQPQPTAGDDVDRLAMLAYQTGRYEAAEKLTASTDRALGLWVRAKLGLRRGDRAAAISDLDRGAEGHDRAARPAGARPAPRRARGRQAQRRQVPRLDAVPVPAGHDLLGRRRLRRRARADGRRAQGLRRRAAGRRQAGRAPTRRTAGCSARTRTRP